VGFAKLSFLDVGSEQQALELGDNVLVALSDQLLTHQTVLFALDKQHTTTRTSLALLDC
jgi:hypothetical protein